MVLGTDTGADHAQIAVEWAELDWPDGDRPGLVDNVDHAAVGVGRNRRVGHQKRAVRLRRG